MTTDSIRALLAEDDHTWAELTAVLDAHPDVNLHAAGSKPWNSRDAYAHLARWLEYDTAKINAVVAGKPLPVAGKSVEEVNARWEAEDSSLSLEEARQRAFMSYRKRQHTIESVPVSEWDVTIKEVTRTGGASHFKEHLSYITLTDARPYPSTATEP